MLEDTLGGARERVPRTAPHAGHATEAIRAAAAYLPAVAACVLALLLNTWRLSIAGYGDTYYAAAVRSMTLSWSNFFYGSFDPGGFITVDKPPLFLWVGALSARVFGYSPLAILLPSAVAGAASVTLLWLIVRRYFGPVAAAIAAFALALSPVSVATNRLNLPEPFLILLLIGAAGAVLRSIESRRWRAWTVLAGVLVGLAFNTKMLAAWIPGPAFAAAIVLALPAVGWRQMRELLVRLALLGGATLIVSASWMVAVDALPRSDRPYIGGSTNDSALNLALGYNGFARLQGDAGGPPPVEPDGQAPGGIAGPGGIFGGYPGVTRLVDAANGGQIGWLLPFAAAGGVLALWSARRDRRRRAAAGLWLGWVGLYGVVFSSASGTFHAFYTASMAPGVAALTGVGAASLADAVRRDRRWIAAIVAIVALTAWTQLHIAGRVPEFYGWVRIPMLATAIAGLAATSALSLRRAPALAGLSVCVAGLLLLPAAWSLSAATHASLNASLPQAGPQRGLAGETFGSQDFDYGTDEVAVWMDAHRDPHATWQLVVPNSQEAATLIARYGFSVMAIGGFLGRDDAISVDRFSDLAARGAVRYVLLSDAADATDNPVLYAVGAACELVPPHGLPERYRYLLYDCRGRAQALRAQAVATTTLLPP